MKELLVLLRRRRKTNLLAGNKGMDAYIAPSRGRPTDRPIPPVADRPIPRVAVRPLPTTAIRPPRPYLLYLPYLHVYPYISEIGGVSPFDLESFFFSPCEGANGSVGWISGMCSFCCSCCCCSPFVSPFVSASSHLLLSPLR